MNHLSHNKAGFFFFNAPFRTLLTQEPTSVAVPKFFRFKRLERFSKETALVFSLDSLNPYIYIFFGLFRRTYTRTEKN